MTEGTIAQHLNVHPSYIEQENSELDPLSSYLSNYVFDDKSYEESRGHVVFRKGVKCLTTAIGSVAGVPWVYSGAIVADRLACPSLFYLIGAGVILSYGATSIWAFSEVVDNLLKPKSKEERAVLSSLANKQVLRHIVAHLLGGLGAIPTFYLSYEYNSIKQYAILAGTIAYIFNVFGVYKLQDIFISLLKGNKSTGSSTILLSQAIETMLIPKITLENLSTLQGSNVEEFYKFLQSNITDKTPITSSKNQHYKYGVTAFMLCIFPTLDAIFLSISMSKAIAGINQSMVLNVTGTFLTVLPLYGLDFFSVKESAYTLFDKLNSNTANRTEASSKLIFFMALSLSAFSAMTNAYVAYDQIDASPLSQARFVFGSCTLLLTTALQTIGFYTLLMLALQECQAFCKPSVRLLQQKKQHLMDFCQLLVQCPADIYQQHEQYSQETILGATTAYANLLSKQGLFNAGDESMQQRISAVPQKSYSSFTDRLRNLWPFSNNSSSGYIKQGSVSEARSFN